MMHTGDTPYEARVVISEMVRQVKEWDPLFREQVKSATPVKSDRGEKFKKKKKGKSADDIAFRETSDVARGALKKRLAWAGVMTSPLVLLVFFGVYFEGHFVTSVPGTATKTPFRRVPSTTTSRPERKRSGTEPL